MGCLCCTDQYWRCLKCDVCDYPHKHEDQKHPHLHKIMTLKALQWYPNHVKVSQNDYGAHLQRSSMCVAKGASSAATCTVAAIRYICCSVLTSVSYRCASTHCIKIGIQQNETDGNNRASKSVREVEVKMSESQSFMDRLKMSPHVPAKSLHGCRNLLHFCVYLTSKFTNFNDINECLRLNKL